MCNILRGGGKLFYLTLKKMKAIHIITALALALSYPSAKKPARTNAPHTQNSNGCGSPDGGATAV